MAIILTDKENQIIELIRSIKFGELTVILEDNKPVRIKKTESIK